MSGCCCYSLKILEGVDPESRKGKEFGARVFLLLLLMLLGKLIGIRLEEGASHGVATRWFVLFSNNWSLFFGLKQQLNYLQITVTVYYASGGSVLVWLYFTALAGS